MVVCAAISLMLSFGILFPNLVNETITLRNTSFSFCVSIAKRAPEVFGWDPFFTWTSNVSFLTFLERHLVEPLSLFLQKLFFTVDLLLEKV